MDDYYDFEAACLQLDVLSKQRISTEPQLQLATFAQDDGGLDMSVVQHLPNENIQWRLTKASDGSDELEEIVLRIQGVLCEKELPPVRIGNRAMAQCARYLKQSVTLAGLNSEFFPRSLESISAVDVIFSKHFESGETVPWNRETYLDYDAVTFANRYFSDVKKQSYMQGVPFTKLEDPTGKMASLGSESGFLHCEENVVKYFCLQKDRAVSASPLIFSSGDLVEALVSFAMVRSGQRYNLRPILRGLTLLDNAERKKATAKRCQDKAHAAPAPSRFKLKRKVGYADLDSMEEEGAIRGVRKLNIDKDVSTERVV